MLRFIYVILLSFILFNVSVAQSDRIKEIHDVLTAFYVATNGGEWRINAGWDTTIAPMSMLEFNQWWGSDI